MATQTPLQSQIQGQIGNIRTANIGNIPAPFHPVVTAMKALDYLDGAWYHHLVALLDSANGIKDWRKRGVIPIGENYVGKIVTRSALTYEYPPTRGIWQGDVESEALSDLYTEVMASANADEVLNENDRVSRLLKCGLVMPVWSNEDQRFVLNLLHRGNCDVNYDRMSGKMNSLMYTGDGVSANGHRLYTLITCDIIYDIEDGEQPRIIGSQVNPYGIIPVAWQYDETIPRVGFFPSSEAYQDIVNLNEAMNFLNTLIFFGARWQTLSTAVTNIPFADGTVIGPDSPVRPKGGADMMPDVPPFFEFKSPIVNIAEFWAYISDLCDRIADTWGVNLKIAGKGGASSGFQLIVEEFWNLETRIKRIKHSQTFEKRLYKVIATMGQVHGLPFPLDAEMIADFPDPKLPVNALEEWQIKQQKMAAKVMSRSMFLKSEDPTLTDEDIAKILAEIDGDTAAKATAFSSPAMKASLAAQFGGNDDQAGNSDISSQQFRLNADQVTNSSTLQAGTQGL